MSRSVAVIAVLACFAVAILTACGSSDSEGSSTADSAAATNAETTAPAATNAETTAPATATAPSTTSQKKPTDKATVVARCHEVLDPLIAQLHKIEATVDGTPVFVKYRAATNKLQAAYSTFRADSIPSGSCMTAVSVPTATAYIAHVGAANTWAECRKRGKCSKVLPELEKQWRDASKLVVKADKGFARVAPN